MLPHRMNVTYGPLIGHDGIMEVLRQIITEGIKEAETLGGGCSCSCRALQVPVLDNIKASSANQLEVAWVKGVPGVSP